MTATTKEVGAAYLGELDQMRSSPTAVIQEHRPDPDQNALSEATTAMAVIRGRYISLSSSQQRRQRLEQHLQTLGVQEHYSWFPAVVATPKRPPREDCGPANGGCGSRG